MAGRAPTCIAAADIGGTFTDIILRLPDDGRRPGVVRLGPDLASRLGARAGALVELWGRDSVPVRAWVNVDAQAGDQLPLSEETRRILGVSSGDAVTLRLLRMDAGLR